MIASRRVRPDEHGAGVVEFALLAPVVFLLLVGIVDMGRSLQAYSTLGDAVRATARDAAVHGAGAAQPWGPAANDQRLVTAVRGRAVGLVAEEVAVSSSWPAGNNALGSEVVVSATYTFRPVAMSFLGDVTVPLSATTRARIYR